MKQWGQWGTTRITLHLILLIGLLVTSGIIHPLYAQDNSSAGQEVYLTFQFRGIINKYVTTYYKDDAFYLPVNELLNQLKIPHQVNQGTLSITGKYPDDNSYKLNFKTRTAYSGDTTLNLTAEDFLIKELDYYVKPEIFKKIFGLSFTTNFNNLTLDLSTDNMLPVIQQYEREQKRKRLNSSNQFNQPGNYPLKYDRKAAALSGGFLDYDLSYIYDNKQSLFYLNDNLGMEFLGGDLQGNTFASVSDEQQTFITNGLRWRYVKRNNPYFSNAIVGQTQSEGIVNRSIRGVKVSNKPVEPRTLFDQYVIEGSDIPPESEVELYLNNRLVDYQKADDGGNYRFVVPLTYGNTEYSLRIYTPSGRSIERNALIQIPFNYLPDGEVDYTVSAGQLENAIIGSTDRGYMASASMSAGLAPWLTAKASSEYLTNYHTTLPSFTGTLNARLFSNYLLSASINSENFYSLSSSVVYRSGTSWNVSYDYNPGKSIIYGIGGNFNQQAHLNFYTPLQLGLPLNFRWSSTFRSTEGSNLLRYRADLSSRLGRLNVRLGYRDQQIGELSLKTTSNSQITNSYSYSVGSYSNLPSFLRSTYIRTQLSYLPQMSKMEEIEFQLSRDILQDTQVQFQYQHNFLGNFNSLSLNVSIDFNKTRSTTSARMRNSSASFNQTLRGSVGYYPTANQFTLQNRQQVGQAGAAVRLFVDKNNDGSFQDSTDQIISDPAVRIDRSGGYTEVKNGINFVNRLLPYYRYDLEINKGALSNPLLVPEVDKFSIVTDPNQYKTIEIPFYQSGVISGNVQRMRSDSSKGGIGGVRLYLESRTDSVSGEDHFKKEMTTFSEGSFYTYEIPPGSYNLYVDPAQLGFLKSVSEPDTMKVEIEALSQGDFKEGLQFTLIPNEMYEDIQAKRKDTVTNFSKRIKKAPDIVRYKKKISADVDRALRLIVESQNAFYNRNLTKALTLVKQSLAIFETAEGYALKGSLQYLRGDKMEAQKSWDKAKSFNPDIYIPDKKTLEQRIKIEEKK